MKMQQVLQTFFEESRELLEQMESILLDVESEAISTEQMNALFRTMHTIKGSAGLFAFDEIVHFSHQVEDVLDQLRSGTLVLSDALTGLLLQCHDQVQSMLNARLEGGSANTELAELVLHQLEALVADQTLRSPPLYEVSSLPTQKEESLSETRWLLSLRLGPDMFRNGMDPVSLFDYLQTLGQIERIACISVNLPQGDQFDPETHYLRYELIFIGHIDQSKLEQAFEFAREGSRILICPLAEATMHQAEFFTGLSDEEVAAVHQIWNQFGVSEAALLPATPSNEPSQGKYIDSQFIKVDAGKLDLLINLMGELVIASAAANLIANRERQPVLIEATQTISTLVEQIRAGTLAMRMIQIGEIFQRFVRVVHDTAKVLGKPIQLQISGADTELDRAMVDKLGDPLMHLVRNALDHGIETTEIRLKKGKPAVGRLQLNAYHESGSMVIEVTDDGAGIDPEQIRAKALERGLIAPEAELSESELFKLLFKPGFTTSERITELSGRGVGLDAVQTNLEQLRGALEIDSTLGKGTTFRIHLPLTLAIIDGLLVKVSNAVFVVPLDAVIECMELAPNSEIATACTGLDLRGEMLPLLRLSRFFNLPTTTNKRQNVVVVRFGEHQAGLVVDQLLGEFQTVIKPLGNLFRHLKAISGSTILGNGSVALILDVLSLIEIATQQEADQYLSPSTRQSQNRVLIPPRL